MRRSFLRVWGGASEGNVVGRCAGKLFGSSSGNLIGADLESDIDETTPLEIRVEETVEERNAGGEGALGRGWGMKC